MNLFHPKQNPPLEGANPLPVEHQAMQGESAVQRIIAERDALREQCRKQAADLIRARAFYDAHVTQIQELMEQRDRYHGLYTRLSSQLLDIKSIIDEASRFAQTIAPEVPVAEPSSIEELRLRAIAVRFSAKQQQPQQPQTDDVVEPPLALDQASAVAEVLAAPPSLREGSAPQPTMEDLEREWNAT